MASDEMEMGSLFEGMVLFDPNYTTTITNNSETEQEEEDEHQSKPKPPLDENLFCDLTLVTPSEEAEAEAEADHLDPTPTLSRQVSSSGNRKKKRAAGLRIGYARDHHPPPLASPGADVQISEESKENEAAAAAAAAAEELKEESKEKGRGVESKYEQIRGLISEKVEGCRQLASSLSSSRKESTSARRQAAHLLRLASLDHSQLEKQLQDACDSEDFHTADALSHRLASADLDNQRLLLSLRDAEAHCDAIDTQMQDLLLFQIAAEQHSASLLLRFSLDAANEADSLLKNAEVLSSKEMDKWLSSTEALEVKKLELEIESHLINDAHLLLSGSIEQSIENDMKEKEQLSKKKDVLTDELEKLLALVREKEAEIAENDSSIEAVDKRIDDMISGFQEAQSSIETKYDNLKSGLSEMKLEGETLSMKKNEIDDFLSREEDRVAKVRELARLAEDEAKACQEAAELRKSLLSSIFKSREDKTRLAKTEEKLSEDVHMLRQEASVARASLQELSATKSSIQQVIATSKQRIFYIDKRVPELEPEKKVAAAARNFKEAARIAADVKTLAAEKESAQTKLDKDLIELGKLDEKMTETVNKLQETEGLILTKEKEVAMARFQRLLLISGAAAAERLAALELGDIEEANLLLAEAEAADAEAKKLQPVYNLREEDFTNLPKHFLSMELVSSLGATRLAELASSTSSSSAHISSI